MSRLRLAFLGQDSPHLEQTVFVCDNLRDRQGRPLDRAEANGPKIGWTVRPAAIALLMIHTVKQHIGGQADPFEENNRRAASSLRECVRKEDCVRTTEWCTSIFGYDEKGRAMIRKVIAHRPVAVIEGFLPPSQIEVHWDGMDITKDAARLTELSDRITAAMFPEKVRVSMAVLIQFELDGKCLLVQSLHRKECFVPFGGVYKYHHTAQPDLDSFNFVSHETMSKDLRHDLRGFVNVSYLCRFKKWFEFGEHRETLNECLTRELQEELREVAAPESLIERVREYDYELLRTVHEGPRFHEGLGYVQYRHLDIVTPKKTPEGNETTRLLFELVSHRPDQLLIASRNDIDVLRSASGKLIGGPAKYYYDNKWHGMELPRIANTERLSSEDVAKTLEAAKPDVLGGASTLIPVHFSHKNYSRSIVARATVKDSRYYVKLYTGRTRYLEKEIAANTLLRKHGFTRMPRLVQCKADKPPFLLVFEEAKGEALCDLSPEKVHENLPKVIGIVREFCDIKLPRYGEIVGEYEWSANDTSLTAYTERLLAHWHKTISDSGTSLVGCSALDRLRSWDGPVESSLTQQPCFCHSDVKLTDIFIGEDGPLIIDFDNVFAFVPEYDLAKLHLSLLKFGHRIELPRYCEVVASSWRTTPDDVERGLRSVYHFMLLRLLQWACTREDFDTIEEVSEAAKLLA